MLFSGDVLNPLDGLDSQILNDLEFILNPDSVSTVPTCRSGKQESGRPPTLSISLTYMIEFIFYLLISVAYR